MLNQHSPAVETTPCRAGVQHSGKNGGKQPVRFRSLALRAVLAALVSGVAAIPALAAFPDKPLKIIVPFSPGGGTDMVARTIADGMAKDLGQPVIVENKPGAGTIIGTDAVAKSEPDGYTLVMATFAHAVNPSIKSKLPYSTDKGFAPVVLVGRSPNVLVVRADRPYKTVKDIVNFAQANPGKLSYGSQGIGTSAHLAGALFNSLAKVDIVHVAYRGAGPAMTDLLGGQIDMMFATAAAAGSHVESGKLRAIAVTTPERSPAMPDVPTIAEGGVPGYAAESWYGLYAPANTPRDVVMRINAAVRKAVQSEVFRKRVESEGLVISTGAPEELDRYVRAEEARWRKVVKEANITLD